MSLDQFVKEARRYKPLDKKEERLLISKIQKHNSKIALDYLVHCNLMIVVKTALKFRNQGLEIEDLVGAGNMGLIEAAKRFELSRENKFITYAVWWIRQAIRMAIFNSRTIRIAVNKEELLRKMMRDFSPRNVIGGQAIDCRALAEKYKIDQSKVESLISFSESSLSFDKETDDGTTLHGIIEDKKENALDGIISKEFKEQIKNAINSLDERESYILKSYFGIKCKKISLAKIGEDMSLSKERIRQIKDEALRKIEDYLS